jgi:hypothetical protein
MTFTGFPAESRDFAHHLVEWLATNVGPRVR